MAEAGADVIELGVPFSDPMADGPVIQKASERALARGIGLPQVLAGLLRLAEPVMQAVLPGPAQQEQPVCWQAATALLVEQNGPRALALPVGLGGLAAPMTAPPCRRAQPWLAVHPATPRHLARTWHLVR